jgi:hypothetical protein
MLFTESPDQEFLATSDYYANNTASELRGTIYITFHNDLGIPLHSPISSLSGGGGTLALFLGGETEIITSPTYTTPFHAPYAHFHAAVPPGYTGAPELQKHFPDTLVVGQVGPPFSGPQGNPTGASDWILLATDIPDGTAKTWGPHSLHQRELGPAADNFSFSVMLLPGALTPEDEQKVKAAHDAAQAGLAPVAEL